MNWSIMGIVLLLAISGAGCDDEDLAGVALELGVEPAEVDFGAVFVGETARRPVQLVNGSRAAVPVRFGQASEFSLEPAHLVVPAGGAVDAHAVFTPAEPGERTAVLRAEGDAGFSLRVRGAGALHDLVAPKRLDFGAVRVGSMGELELPLENRSIAPQAVALAIAGEDAALFSAPPKAVLAAGRRVVLPVRFEPGSVGQRAGRLELTLCEDCEPRVVELSGEGYSDAVGVLPAELDFGRVLAGATREAAIRVKSDSAVPLPLVSAELVQTSGLAFSSALPAPGIELGAYGALDLAVVFTPPRTGVFSGFLRLQVGLALVEVPIRGEGVAGALDAEPPLLDLGAVAPGATVRRTVSIRASAPELRVNALGVEGEVAFSIAAPSLPAEAHPEALEVEVTFGSSSRGAHVAELVVGAELEGLELRVPLVAAVVTDGPCALTVAPAAVHFGLVPVGTTTDRTVELRNAGSGDCDVWKAEMVGDGAFALLGDPAWRSLAPGEAATIGVAFAPTHASLSPSVATLRIYASPAGSKPIELALDGQATDLGLVATPSPLDFGGQPIGTSRLRSVELRLGGAGRIDLLRAVVEGSPMFALLPFELPRTLRGGEAQSLGISFTPGSVGEEEAELQLFFRDVAEPVRVPLLGEGLDVPCTGACLEPQVICPSDRKGYVHTRVPLAGAALAERGVASCELALTAVLPAGSSPTLLPTGACAAALIPDLAGTYEVELTATDTAGARASCTVRVDALPLPALHVETTWSASDDVDLHLFHPDAGPLDDLSTWFAAPGDCFFANAAPAWDEAGRADDPRLERDDRVGSGPEQISIDAPVIGHAYRVGVHWFDTANGNASLDVTTRIFCAGALVAEETATLDQHHEAAIVGSVRFTGADTCSFTADGAQLVVPP